MPQLPRFIKSFSFLVSVLTLSLSLAYLVLAWTEPSVNPPNSDPNVFIPLNTGSTGQSKAGNLTIHNATNTASLNPDILSTLGGAILNTGGSANGLIVDKGNVGIGTASPGAVVPSNSSNIRLIEIKGGMDGYDAGLSLRRSDNVVGLDVWTKTGNAYETYFDNRYEGSDFVWRTGTRSGGTERMRLKSNGNVGIGTADPSAKLHIGGTAGVDGIKFPDGTLQTSAATGGAMLAKINNGYYVGNGVANRAIPHGLGAVPIWGMIIQRGTNTQFYFGVMRLGNLFITNYQMDGWSPQIVSNVDATNFYVGLPIGLYANDTGQEFDWFAIGR